MADGSDQICTRFPWWYLAAALVPSTLVGGVFVLPVLLGQLEAMGPAMLCSLLIGPAGAVVVGWGLVRLWGGDGQRFPALRWLVWLPVAVGFTGVVLG